ncbi:type VI secretion system baseplate subunit TssE [Pseudomonas sp. MF6755]|uniref:type VI secretion system baseplate subunit TssE n=1 Tax=Pseudomonas sp. MF6755 TaxID=2797530 RepID=UPI0018E76225|nr:type VI secretion system baseplate subunit TssE [Pseudomonas sp. MF6755]MBJ2285862.1 type VI secretion system baseplate subunit TssE [Pseudomonas sp. MF6755]
MLEHNSLFERLEYGAQARACPVASVAAHLGKMLSTREGSVQALPDYDLPDLNDMRLSLHESLTQSRLHIERVIQVYEPRLASVRVRLLPGARESLALAFAIEAELVIDGVLQSVVFHARLADPGRVEVCADGF